MTQVELIMEVDGGFLEGGHDVLVEGESRPDDEGCQFQEGGFEAFEVALEEGGVDEEEGLVVGEGDGGGPEVPHVPGVDEEGTSRRVHGCQHLGVDDILEGQLSNIVPMFVIGMLPEKGDGALCVINIKLGHVEIINEIDKFLFALGAELFSCNFLQKLLELHLKICGIGVV